MEYVVQTNWNLQNAGSPEIFSITDIKAYAHYNMSNIEKYTCSKFCK